MIAWTEQALDGQDIYFSLIWYKQSVTAFKLSTVLYLCELKVELNLKYVFYNKEQFKASEAN